MAKVIKGIQNLSMSLRMVSVKQAFQKAARVGRDTAAELGKKVNISVMGEETEVDRDIADKLLDPLMHLVRNSISHGIEEEGERQKRGKTEEGHLSIQAYSKRGSVYIEVADDGTGLSIENIRAKALEKKLIDPDRNYSTDEIIRLIFLPGFSTSEKVDSISGRGVGMNVVETEMKKVGGKIDIVNRPGKGCRFILKIPLNLAVMNGTIVDICGERYVLPTLYIKQFIRPEDNQWVKVKNEKKMIRVRDEIIRVVPVGMMLGTEEPLGEEDNSVVIIIEAEQKLVALPVRNIIGRQEVVAKPLGKEFGVIDFASGASILGDGKVSLILDVEAMFKADN
jgi:two-component system chemotaxis sensor kinase CheA